MKKTYQTPQLQNISFHVESHLLLNFSNSETSAPALFPRAEEALPQDESVVWE